MRRTNIRSLPLLAFTLLLTACGPFRRGSGGEPATIVFENGAMDQATLFIVGPGSDFRRIGVVSPGRTDTLRVPPEYAMRAGSLNIIARLLARSDVPATGPVTIRPGETYQVRLSPDGRMLSFLPAP